MARKTFVLDTSVLIHDPFCIWNFEDNDVMLPFVVVHEIDGLRSAPNGRGMAAREVMRQLEKIRMENVESGLSTVSLGDGKGDLIFEDPEVDSAIERIDRISKGARDGLVISCARSLSRRSKNPVIIVSKDTGLRLKASIMSMGAEDYRNSKIDWDKRYTGVHDDVVHVESSRDGQDLLDGDIAAPDDILENEFCYVVVNGYESVGPIICRRKDGLLKPIDDWKRGISGVRPKDDRQRMAMDVLMDPDVTCVVLTGPPGGGKTLLSLAAGLQNLSTRDQEKIMAIKPIIAVGGNDIGYLKGDKNDKLLQWLKPIFDNLQAIEMFKGRRGDDDDDFFHRSMGESMLIDGSLELEALTFMRGRSLHGYWVILDEGQNTTEHEIKTALSRIGDNTKVILLADLSQIDSQYVDAQSCGASRVIEALKGDPLFATVNLNEAHRSPFARLVSERMS